MPNCQVKTGETKLFYSHREQEHTWKISSTKEDIQTLLPIARPKPHGTAPASMSPTYGLRSFFTLIEEYSVII